MEMMVYAVLAQGSDYYDQLQLESLWLSRDDAEAHAAQLRVQEDEWLEGELAYDCVVVEAQPVR